VLKEDKAAGASLPRGPTVKRETNDLPPITCTLSRYSESVLSFFLRPRATSAHQVIPIIGRSAALEHSPEDSVRIRSRTALSKRVLVVQPRVNDDLLLAGIAEEESETAKQLEPPPVRVRCSERLSLSEPFGTRICGDIAEDSVAKCCEHPCRGRLSIAARGPLAESRNFVAKCLPTLRKIRPDIKRPSVNDDRVRLARRTLSGWLT